MNNYKKLILIAAILLGLISAAQLFGEEPRQVMPARQRAQIVATAKALFEPQIKKTLKVGKVSSPFTAVAE